MQRVGPRWFALASLLWCVSGPSGVLFTTAPIRGSANKDCNLVLGSAALKHRRCRSQGSALTARVIAQLIEYQPPPGTETAVQEEVISAVSSSATVDGTVVVLLAILVAIASAVLFSVSTNEDAAAKPKAGTPTRSTTTAAPSTASAKRATASYAAENRPDEFRRGQRVTMLGALASIGKEGAILGPARGNTYAVQLDSGSIVHTAPQNFQLAAGQAPAVATAQSTSTSASTAPAKPKNEHQFVAGQRVSILSPPKMAGKVGSIMGPIGANTFAVQLETGSIFHFAAENIQDAAIAAAASPALASPTPAAGELVFTSGQHVMIIAPPALAGKQGSIVGPAENDSYAVRMASGSIFHFPTKNIKGAASASSSASSSSSSSAPEFTPGQKVSVLRPSKMAGMMGSIVGPAGADSFTVQFASGSIFHFATGDIQDAAAGVAAAAQHVAVSPRAEDLHFVPGQRVTFTHPRSMAGKYGSIVGPAEGNSFAVQLTSGSIFHFATESLQDATPVRAY
eukprot:TRINITY_DN57956_c0_g1_i1.p1 TRINITY_DN57956_c0_g1~~TRINITY_DN57956_c0_g1_i1.p1  ORF type:complete len:511 (+),score=88.69 TRINITY_DN57956_c0_g1_i1:59-1591(+)